MAKGKKTGGRKPGSPNKITASIKAAWKEAFEELGGVKSLVAWARDNQTEFYKQSTKLIPTEIANADGETFKVEQSIPENDRAILEHYMKTRGKND
jgi:hypothetical protein